MTAGTQRSQLGFTLVELLVGVAVAAVVCMGALALLSAQQRAFRSSTDDRAIQEKARSALTEIGANLRRAGYGVEPWLAFDFGPVANGPPSFAGGPGTTSGYPAGRPSGSGPTCGPSGSVTARDRTDGPDEIVFYARDPAFSRTLSAAPTSSTLRFATALSRPLYQGQILQVMCGAASAWVYVQVATTAAAGATSVALTSCSTGFPFQQGLIGAPALACLTTGTAYLNARVFKVDRFHYYVDRYPDSVTGTRPYLMLDRGLWNDGTPLVEPVAPDVEDLQIAYLFPRSTTAPLVGVAAALQDATDSIDLSTAVPPAYTDLNAAPSRFTNSPANLRAVRVSVAVRTPTPDRTSTNVSASLPAAANRPAMAADANHRRIVVETTEPLRNLESRGPFFPAYGTPPAAGSSAPGLVQDIAHGFPGGG